MAANGGSNGIYLYGPVQFRKPVLNTPRHLRGIFQTKGVTQIAFPAVIQSVFGMLFHLSTDTPCHNYPV